MPVRQSLRLATYLARQRILGREKFPLLVELEPLFACNLKCAGCGKIAQPAALLKQRMSVEQAVGAIEEWGTDGLDRGRRAAHAQGDRRDRPPVARPRQDRVLVHERGAPA